MDLGFNITGTRRPETFRSVTGVIEALEPMGNRGSESCTLLAQLQTSQEGPVGLLITPDTYVVDYEPLSVGMTVTFWYRTDAPAPLIYPPRYYAAVAAAEREGRMVDVSYYDGNLVNENRTLGLNLDTNGQVRLVNNQYYQGNPGNHNLVVSYSFSTRSIPAQTTPDRVVVLCD